MRLTECRSIRSQGIDIQPFSTLPAKSGRPSVKPLCISALEDEAPRPFVIGQAFTGEACARGFEQWAADEIALGTQHGAQDARCRGVTSVGEGDFGERQCYIASLKRVVGNRIWPTTRRPRMTTHDAESGERYRHGEEKRPLQQSAAEPSMFPISADDYAWLVRKLDGEPQVNKRLLEQVERRTKWSVLRETPEARGYQK